MRFFKAIVVAGCVAGSAIDVAAQTDDSRFYINLNGAFEPGSQTYSDSGTFRKYEEDGTLNVSSEVSSGAVFDVSAGLKITGNFTFGLGFHRTSSSDDATVKGTAPDPLFFNRPRAFAQTVNDLTRTEQALHISLGYLVPLGERFDLHLTAGPSSFRFDQQVPAGVTIAETGATFTSTVVVENREDSAWGGHVGADFSYAVVEGDAATLRLGAFVRYAAAASDFLVVSNTASTKLGGVQFGAGLRVRF